MYIRQCSHTVALRIYEPLSRIEKTQGIKVEDYKVKYSLIQNVPENYWRNNYNEAKEIRHNNRWQY